MIINFICGWCNEEVQRTTHLAWESRRPEGAGRYCSRECCNKAAGDARRGKKRKLRRY